ncbi:MAG: WD40 repeat domain-containing protein, partial [Candidatus Sumerlaeia bacterium]|nr:WD40 repeat domain-containing protein [Candidatus Sumerlaeia bacterium]
MKPKRVLANLLLLLAIALAGAVAQPANDHFANATLLSGLSGSVDGSTIGATRELFEPRHWYGGDEADAPSVWYRWVAPASGTVRFGTCGAASFPTAMVAYTGLLHNDTLWDVARQPRYDFPSCASPGGRILVSAVAGVTYHVAVAGRQEGSTGTFRLDWEYVRPENDDFADATLLSGPWGAVVGSHEGATVEPGEPDHGQAAARASIWWRWTAPDNGDWIFEACGSEFNVVLAVYTGAALEDLAPVQANRSHCGGGNGRGAKFRARAGTTYAIAVDSEEGSPGLRGTVQLSWGKWGDTRQQLGLGRRPWSVAFAGADALRYVTSSSRGALLRDTQTDDVIRTFSGHTLPVESVAVSHDGSRIVTGGGSVAYLWDAVTGAQLAGLAGHAANIRQVALSPDAGFVATTSWDEKARIWNTTTGELLHVIPVEQGNWPFAVALTPDNSRFVIGSHSKVTIYDMATGNEIRVIPRPNEVVSTIAVSPDGTHLLTGTLTAAVTMWNLETGALVRTFTGHTGVNGGPVAFSRDGTRALVGSTEAVIWDAATGEVLQTFQNAEGVLSLDLSADNARLITASNDRNVRLWDATTGELLRVVPGYTEIVWDVAISGDGRRVATVSGDLGEGRAMIWDPNTGGLLRDSLAHAQMPTAVAISSDGRRLLTGSLEHVARYWDAESGELLHDLPHAFYVSDVAISTDGTRLLTTSWDKTARMWNAATGTLLRTFTGHTAPVTACALAPDNSQVATGSSDGTIIVWNPETASVIRTLEGGNHFRSLVYSSDGAHLLGCSEFAGARLWNAATGELLRAFHDRSGLFSHATFSPNDTRILTSHDRGVLRLWDTQTGELLRTFHGHTGPASAAAFTPDGSRVVSGSHDGTALVWELAPPRAIIVAGGGAYVGNPIARQTNDLGVYAWRTLRARGYAPEEILYLSAFPDGHDFGDGLPPVAWDLDGDGIHEVDGFATRAGLEAALAGSFAREAGRLMILMIDHGYKTGDFMAFRLNPTEAVLTTTMNGWLNDLQNAAPVDVTLVVDSCYSGRFVLDCKKTNAIPAARDRIVIASTSPTAESVFLPAPDLTSFIHTFLGSAYMGNSMGEAWRSGQRFFARFPVANQRPMIDDGSVQASDDETPT